MCNCKTCVDETFAEIREELAATPIGSNEYLDFWRVTMTDEQIATVQNHFRETN